MDFDPKTRQPTFLHDLATLGDSEQLSRNRAEELLKRFATYDDPWWISVLRSTDKGRNDKLLTLSLDLVLRRQRSFQSLWKRKGDLGVDELKQLNAQADLAKSEPERFAILRRDLQEKDDTLLVLHTFKPYSVRAGRDLNSSILLVKTRHGLRSASSLSPLIRSLNLAWKEDIHLHAFSPMISQMSAEALLKKLSGPTKIKARSKAKSSKAKPRHMLRRSRK